MGILEWFLSLSQNTQSIVIVFGSVCVLATIAIPILIVLENADKRWKLKFKLEKEKLALDKEKIVIEQEKLKLASGRQQLLADAIEVSKSGNHTPLALLAEKNDENT